MCGEQNWISWNAVSGIGSPPRVRGTADEAVDIVMERRITPACAGNSMSAAVATGSAEDHPRVCGEQRISYPVFAA